MPARPRLRSARKRPGQPGENPPASATLVVRQLVWPDRQQTRQMPEPIVSLDAGGNHAADAAAAARPGLTRQRGPSRLGIVADDRMTCSPFGGKSRTARGSGDKLRDFPGPRQAIAVGKLSPPRENASKLHVGI